MRLNHLRTVVDMHLACFPQFFLSFLGKGFLKQYYRGLMLSENTIAIVSVSDNEEINGFVAGFTDPSNFYRELLNRCWYRFFISAIPAAVKKPTIIPRLIKALRKPTISEKGKETAELASICVMPAFENSGIGKKLVQAFVNEARGVRCKVVVLYTDAQSNDKVNDFYSELGFKLTKAYITPEGRSMNEYKKDIG
jgi:ribosomal protein S18 acetylase RimI-like enzyme